VGMWSRLRPLAVVAPAAVQFYRPAQLEESPFAKDFAKATVVKTEQNTHDTRKVTFQGPLGGSSIVNVRVRAPIGSGKAGCCACCKCGPDCGCPKGPNGCCACCKCDAPCGCPKSGGGNEVRMYNPISLEEDGTFTLLVKKYPNSKMGTHIHNLKVGDSLEVKGPNQQFALPLGKHGHFILLAGGTGITPLIQAAQAILTNDTAKVTIVCANKTFDDRVLVPDLNHLARKYAGRVTLHHVVEEPMPDALPKLLPAPSSDAFVLVCGRAEMVGKVAGPKTPDFQQGPLQGVLKQLGWKQEQVWKV